MTPYNTRCCRGKLLSIGGSLASTVGVKNPYRYRGYRYDTETGLYYLQSRYYDPNTGRFVNADDTGTLNAEQGNPIQQNLYAYCLNNPANHIDSDGNWVLDAIFLAVDVVDFVRHPSVGGAAWVLFDCACFADLSGAASAGSHAIKAAHAAVDAVRSIDEARHAKAIANLARHGNDLRTTKETIGYALRSTKNYRVLKYGETTRGIKRYSKNFYRKNCCRMEIRARGTKRAMHEWQHNKIISYTRIHGHRPPLNKSDW